MTDELISSMTAEAAADIRTWAKALWNDQQPDTRGFADRLAAAMLLGMLEGALAEGEIGRHALELARQRYAIDFTPFKTVFQELLAALTSKSPVLSVLSPRDLDPQLRQSAFFVSGVTSGNVVQQIKDELVNARAEGLSEQSFIQRVAEMTDRTAGELDNVWRTNIASAAGAGRWAQLNDPDVSDMYVGYRYVSRKKPTTRPLHRAMDGFVAVKDDPAWKIIWVPNGYRCLCQIRGVRRQEGIERGLINADGEIIRERVFATSFQEDIVDAAMAGMSVVVDGEEMQFPDEGFRGNALAGLAA